jgi:indolepyruvate decarboxylase
MLEDTIGRVPRSGVTRMNLAEALWHALKKHGTRQVFGIPGDVGLAFFKVMEASGIPPL